MKLNEKQLRKLIRKEILKETFSPMKSIASRQIASILTEDLEATALDFDKKMSDYMNMLVDNPEKATEMRDEMDKMLDQFAAEMDKALEIARKNANLPETYKKKKLDEVDPRMVQRATGLYASASKMSKIKSLMGMLFDETVGEAMEDGVEDDLAEELGLAAVLETVSEGLESLGFLAEANAIRQMQEM